MKIGGGVTLIRCVVVVVIIGALVTVIVGEHVGLSNPFVQQYFPLPLLRQQLGPEPLLAQQSTFEAPFLQQNGPLPPFSQQSILEAPFLQQYFPEPPKGQGSARIGGRVVGGRYVGAGVLVLRVGNGVVAIVQVGF